jgi:hypothetical protein
MDAQSSDRCSFRRFIRRSKLPLTEVATPAYPAIGDTQNPAHAVLRRFSVESKGNLSPSWWA